MSVGRLGQDLVGEVVLFDWAENLSHIYGPDEVKVIGPAESHWRGPEGITVLNESEGVRYVALPHELRPLPTLSSPAVRAEKTNIMQTTTHRPNCREQRLVGRCGKLQPAKWKAWDQGEAAHSRGSQLADNPYRGENDYLAEQWELGWISADNPPPNKMRGALI